MQPNHTIEMFYDGDSPLCMRETRMLGRLDRKKRILFTNIASPEFDLSSLGKTQDELMAEMHGRLPDGTWVTGVEVFRRLYSVVGFGAAVWFTRLPMITQLLDIGYCVFAKIHLRLTGRCDEACSIKEPGISR
jgi:predicted DCC family thiol-disulfide oxidoreductase YuxK